MPVSKKELERVQSLISKEGVVTLQLVFKDLVGRPKNLLVPANLLKKVLEDGIGFDGCSISGFGKVNDSDKYLQPDMSSFVIVPSILEPESPPVGRFDCDVINRDGTLFESDPRYILKKALDRADSMGFRFFTGPEMEYFLLHERNTAVQKVLTDNGEYFDASPTDAGERVRERIVNVLEKIGITVEKAHHEVSPSQHEINILYEPAMRSAEHLALVKYVVKQVARSRNYYATFMPKPLNDKNRNALHIHMSLRDRRGRDVTGNAKAPDGLSPTGRAFIAGLLARAHDMCLVTASTVNSYKAYVLHHEAPVHVCWGLANRSAMVRVIHRSGKPAHIEYRSGDPSGSVYLAYAVILHAGLDGIEQKIELAPPVEQNLYEVGSDLGIETLPLDFGEALRLARQSEFLRRALGEQTFESYLGIKAKEWEDYRVFVTEWERSRYL
ncbi:MAG: glutamine synthetase [Acidobacteria bacterium]|nr:glutamine synthetase [Acidobacteriota bacterium]